MPYAVLCIYYILHNTWSLGCIFLYSVFRSRVCIFNVQYCSRANTVFIREISFQEIE